MAYRKPTELDGFIQLMGKTDMRVKALLAEDLVTFLSDDTNSIVCSDMGMLVDSLMPWLTGSHFKIAQKSLEAFTELIKRMGPDFNAYTAAVLPHVIDRLGDSKDTVREKAQLLLQTLIEYKVLNPQTMLDKLAASCFKHRNAKVREEFLQTIVNTLNEYGTSHLTVRNYIQCICALLGDPTVSVRDSAIQTLVEIYKHVGDRLRPDLRRMEDLPSTKLAILEQKFDQIKSDGLLFKSALLSTQINNNNNHNNNNNNNNINHDNDEIDNIAVRDRPTKIVKRATSAATRSKIGTTNESSGSSAADAGAITSDIFEASFELVPQLTVFHPKDIDDIHRNILIVLSDKNADWDKRVEALKKIRSLLLMNMQSQPQFFTVQLKELSITFLDILKEELRSQVIREACITIAFMSKTLHSKVDKFCEYILEQLIQLIQNSAKVIASASTIALKYIIKYTHAPKLIKIITDTLLNSKSKDIRATLAEIICLLCAEWPTKALERNAPLLRDTLKKSIGDADSDARRHSRRAYWIFKRHFPDLADQIYRTLDQPTQRALERERQNRGVGGGAEEMRSMATVSRISRSQGILQRPTTGVRSISAVDTAAANRAKTRAAQVALSARKKNIHPATTVNVNGTNTSLPRTHVSSIQQSISQSSAATAAGMRTRSRTGVSQSQPGSRSTSPSSKLREQHTIGSYRITGTIPKKSSGIPRSLANSRETSPTRTNNGMTIKRNVVVSSGGNLRRTTERNQPIRQLAAARILQQSKCAMNYFGDVASPDGFADYLLVRDGGRERGGGGGGAGGGGSSTSRLSRKLMSREESDDSEASSVCSERSFDSSYMRGNSSSYSLTGSRNRLDWSWTRPSLEDIDTIIMYCASTHWSERKDGLISLTQYLSDGKELSSQQLQCVLDTFRKMFMDTHTKVYSLFLETVTELILAYANELHEWLFILLTRLFNKLGTELLNSMYGKIWKTLQVVNEYFPANLQIKDVFRILSDSAQTPCIKTRISILKFLISLATTYCKNTDFPGHEEGVIMPLAEKAILKIVQMAGDQKSLELRSQARHCLIALYNLNTPQMTKILSALPKAYQDAAKTCIQTYIRRNSTSSTNSPSSSPLSSASPRPLQSPNVSGGPFSSLQQQFASPRSRQSSMVDGDLGLTYSDIDVHQNIQKTTEEIRNCFGSIDNQYNNLANHTNGSNFNGHFNELLESYASSSSKTQSNTTTESNTPERTVLRLDNSLLENQKSSTNNALVNSVLNQIDASTSTIKHRFADNGEMILENGVHESDIIKLALTLTPDMPVQQVQSALISLGACIKGGNCELPNKHFRAIMKMLLNLLEANSSDIIIEALHVLSKILRRQQIKPLWINFVELILLKVINCYSIGKEIMRELDMLIPRIVPALPLNLTINIVNPVIATGSYPVNLCALRLLTELVDRHGSELTENHLDTIFPHLARLTDDFQSMVRKAAVFCIVRLYIIMGEDKVKPKLTMLNPSKVRLLNVYIEKQRTTSQATAAAAAAAATTTTTATASNSKSSSSSL